MGNIRLNLSSTKRINNVNIYSDMDMSSEYVSKTLYDRAAIRNSISNILSWKPYERILNPSFGNVLWNSLFDNINMATKKSITSAVRDMLSAEPRIEVGNVNVSTNAAANEIFISFSYTIPKLDDAEEQYELTISKK